MEDRIRRGPIVQNCGWCHQDIDLGGEYYVGDKEYCHERFCAQLYKEKWGIGTLKIPDIKVQIIPNNSN